MKKQRIISPYVNEPPEGTWSNCLVIGDHIHIAGLTAGGMSDEMSKVGEYEQAKEIFRRRINDLVYDQRDVCDGPSMRDSVETNAFIYPSSGCSFLLLGLLRRPFADARYDDLSLSLRVGYVIAHVLPRGEPVTVLDVTSTARVH